MIDLHLHTTASDGRCDPAELVRRAWSAGIRVLSVTDHDTVAALEDTIAASGAYGIEVVPGIEVTAVNEGHDVHVLGYFFDRDSPGLAAFLEQQRADRVRRVEEMAARLAALGKPIDVADLTRRSETRSGRSVGRPLVAGALVRAGHVADVRQAFDELIGEGRPAYLPHRGRPPADVVAVIREAGGIASLAHPGLLGDDPLVVSLAGRGLAAIEAYHGDHDADTTARYLAMAAELGLGVTGGSDYHGDADRRRDALGTVALPEERYNDLVERARREP